MIHATCKNYSNFCDWTWITIFWKIGLLYYKFSFLTPRKEKYEDFWYTGKKDKQRKKESLKNHRQDLPKTGWG